MPYKQVILKGQGRAAPWWTVSCLRGVRVSLVGWHNPFFYFIEMPSPVNPGTVSPVIHVIPVLPVLKKLSASLPSVYAGLLAFFQLRSVRTYTGNVRTYTGYRTDLYGYRFIGLW